MRILQITDDFPPFVGGMAAHAWELSKALVRLGHSVTVLTNAKVRHTGARFASPTHEILDGMEVINFGFKLGLRRYFGYWSERELRSYLVRFGQAHDEVVLHCHEHMRPAAIRKITNLPLMWTNHSSMFLIDFEDKSKRAELARMLQSCDWVTAPSHELCAKTIDLYYPDERVTYIPNGVDIARFNRKGKLEKRVLAVLGKTLHFNEDDCVVVCARRFVYKNGIHTYLDALEQIPKEVISKCALIFIGNNPSRDDQYGQDMLDRINAISQNVRLHVLGLVPNELMPDVYRVADIALLPSLREATSIAGLESMAAGLPIVGTNAGGIPEIVADGVNGLLSPPGDASAFAQNLAKLVNDPNLRLEMGSQGRRIVLERFSWEKIAQEFVAAYKKLLVYRGQRLHTNREYT